MNTFKGQRSPITNELAPNTVLSMGKYHVSYNLSRRYYGSDTTALVLDNSVFFILNGNHKKEMQDVSESQGLQGCVDYFINNIDKANSYSEHKMACLLSVDHFGLNKTALEIIGQENIDRIKKACENI